MIKLDFHSPYELHNKHYKLLQIKQIQYFYQSHHFYILYGYKLVTHHNYVDHFAIVFHNSLKNIYLLYK